MFTRLLVIALLLLVPGCRPSGPQKRGASAAPKVGPSLERLLSRMRDTAAPAAEREAYWRTTRGTLVSATGAVAQVSGEILLRCAVREGPRGEVFVRAIPTAQHAEALASLRPEQPLTLLGELSGEPPRAAEYGSRSAPVVLTNTRIRIR
jgi:hypothetical protein